MRVLVLQHIACEPPGAFEDVLREREVELVRIELDEGEPLPSDDAFDAVVAMGGPMSANDEAEHPWLADEKRLIASAVEQGVPFWGVCLGVQLLASALGARVYPGPAAEVGLLPIRLTPEGREDPVLGSLPTEVVTLQWHGDTFDLPRGAVLLASSPQYPNQAFRYRDAYGVQFHLELSADMAEEWGRVPEYVASADGVLGTGGLEHLLREFGREHARMRDHARGMFEAFLDRIPAVSA